MHRYRVSVPRPADHLVSVEVEIPCADQGDFVDVTMPAWCPGSYLIRDYARFVRELGARGDDGDPRPVTKIDKSTWRIARADARSITVRYEVYGHELTVRTNHIDATHAFLHGPATFVYAPHLRAAPVRVQIDPPDGWLVATALREGHANSIDELFDSPIHLGGRAPRTFEAGGAQFELVTWGDFAPGGLFSLDTLTQDLAAIASDQCARAGATPFDRYVFVLMIAHDAYGGLEHRASSINLNNPFALANRKSYEALLELLSHELFHAWNGKRIAPAALLDFDYTKEAYTRCLWVMEGVTSHYDRWALRSSRRITVKSFLEKVLDDWAKLMATPGRNLQSLEDSSFDAWIKLYKPDESNVNTTVSYYLKGGLAMLALDLHIRRRTEGARSLDDVLRALWRDFGAKGVPYPEDVEAIFGEAVGLDLAEPFARWIRGTSDPDLTLELAEVGLELRSMHDPAQVEGGARAVWLGLTTAGARITGVLDGSPAQAAGLAPGDELAAIDSFRVLSDADARAILALRAPGDEVELAVWRRNRLVTIGARLGQAPPTRYEIGSIAAPGDARAARFTAWIGEAYPAAPETLASITTTARWI
ncbi:MAG TPA: PDZ domain-containing protein [Kofleriaceae bacterium]|nr:PDZ domain-containing protein [Kofleriaceae bacterium]